MVSVLLVLLLFPVAASAKKLSDRGVARSAVGIQAYYHDAASRANISEATQSTINENKSCFYQMEKITSNVFSLYTLNNYFAVSRDQKKLLLQGKQKLVARGQLLLQKAKRSNGKKIARSLISHGNFSAFYLQSYQVNFCTMKDRIEELGGYSDSNINQAYLEAVNSQPGLSLWLETVDQRGNRLLGLIGLGTEIIAGLGFSTEKYAFPMPLALPQS